MVVDRIGYVEPIPAGRKSGKNAQVGGNDKTDTINLSSDAMKKAEAYQIIELIKSAPELDEARIVELRGKIDDPAYINGAINGTAENILNSWFG